MTVIMLAEVKVMLGIKDTLQDELLRLVITDSRERVLAQLNLGNEGALLLTIPRSVEWVVREVAVKRFNRIGSEGMTTDSEEGRSVSWEGDELSGYGAVLASVVTKRSGRGRARFF